MVTGIIGKTQGVKMASSPPPKATARTAPRSCVSDFGAAAGAAAGAPDLNSKNPAGMETGSAAALGSIVREALAGFFLGGRQRVASQTLYRISTASSAGPAGASAFTTAVIRNSAFSS